MEASLGLLPLEVFAELSLVLSIILGTMAHEAGHAAAGWLAGLDVRTISLGKGPVILRRRVGRLVLAMHAVPLSGFVALAVRPGMSRYRFAAMVAGGPAVNALLLGGLLLLDRAWPYYDLVLMSAAMGQGLILLLTLVPYKARARGGRRPSDGLWLWTQLARRPPDMFATLYAATLNLVHPAGTPAGPPSAAAPDLLFHTSRTDRWFDPAAARDASAAILGLLSGPHLTPAERAVALEFLAANQLLFGASDAPAATLDAWSAEACALAPGPPTTLTRAGVLATTGRGAEADALLRPFADGSGTANQNFLCDLFLAMAAAGQGRSGEMQARLTAARQAARPRTPMRPVLRKVLARAERMPPLAPVPHAAITRA